MSTQSIDNLELRAMEERKQLHDTATELKARIKSTREKFDVRRNAQKHFGPASVIATVVGLASGYLMAGQFVDR